MALGSKSSTNGHRSTTTQSPGSDAASGISRVLVLILTVPARLINWLTTPPGNAIMIGLGVLYFGSVSAEGYWQAMNASNPAFVPKPFVSDGADLRYIFTAIIAPSFWMATVVSLIVQGIQAFVLREIDIAKAKAEYEAIKDYRVPDPEEGQLDLAEYRRKRLKAVGMRTVRTRGALIALTYAIDAGIAFWNYPVIGQSTGEMVINLVWILASIFGTEAMINLFFNAIAPIKPQVEVLPN
jgi:hypothetical protein